MKPIIGINFKTSKQGTGKNALKLLKILNKYRNKAKILAGLHYSDYLYSKKVEFPVYSQNLGILFIEELKATGLVGTFLNHSDHKLRFDVLKRSLRKCEKKTFKTLVFTSSLTEAKKIIPLKPDYLAYEDSKLIGTKKSITKFRSDNVREFAKLCKGKTIPLCGAGIHEKEDLKAAIKLGCKGILMSSAFVKSKDPGKLLREFIGVVR